MDSLDLPVHQLILDDLALNLAASESAQDRAEATQYAKRIYGIGASSSKVKADTQRFMSVSAVRTQISLALFASSISSASKSSSHTVDSQTDEHLIPVLEDLEKLVKDLTLVDFDQSMTWTKRSLPDQLAFALVSSFLKISVNAPQHRPRCMDAILTFSERLATALSAASGDAHIVCVKFAPLFSGLHRALSSVGFGWSLIEFSRLAAVLGPLTSSPQVLRRLDEALFTLPEQNAVRAQAVRATRRAPKKPTIRPRDDSDNHSDGSVDTFFSGDGDEGDDSNLGAEAEGGFHFSNDPSIEDDDSIFRQSLLGQYAKAGLPLSGHYLVYCALEALGSVLAQSLATAAKPPIRDFSDYQKKALDLDKIDPARIPQSERFDLDSEESVLYGFNAGHPSLEKDTVASQKAWGALLRFAVTSGIKESRKTNENEGGNEEISTGSRILNALPIIGSVKGTAAFGVENGAGSTLDVDETLASTLHAASRVYHDTQRFIESEGLKRNEIFADLFGVEILGESFKLCALCSVALTAYSGAQVDSNTVVRIRSILSEQAPIIDPVLQSAALKSVGVLVRNTPTLASPMTRILRHFVTSPLAMFESSPSGAPSPALVAAAKCLAICVTISPGDDLVVSTMYTLLNYLGKDISTGGFAAGGAAGSSVSVRSGASRAVTYRDHGMQYNSSQAHFSSRSEDQKRLINLSTITIISRLALEVNKPDVTALTISMLLQRLRTADPLAEASILRNLVPLALTAPKGAYIDIVKAFSAVSRSAMTGGANRRAAVAVQTAQLKLAQGLGRLEESDDKQEAKDDGEDGNLSGGRKEIFLVELLQLFAEKGMQLQTVAASGKSSSEELAELNTDLATLLPSISAVLEHDDINPQLEPAVEMVSLFRNMWFLSVLFGYASPAYINRTPSNEKPMPKTPAEAQAALVAESLCKISLKTPTLVPETAHNYLESDLEYNSVLKREFSSATLDSQRKSLSALIPNHASEIRSFSYAQVTFLSTIYNLECLRSSMGRPSMILWYFVNDGLNTSSLVGSMQSIADKVITSFIQDVSRQVDDHALDPRVSSEVRNLMLGSCHRVSKVRAVSQSILDKLIYALPSLLCDQDVIVTMLEILTLLRHGCECEYRDEYSPVYHFKSERANISFDLSDSYAQRNEILASFLQRSKSYLNLVLARAPVELQGILQRYLSSFDDSLFVDHSELGKSIALDYARAMPPTNRQGSSLPPLGGSRSDNTSSFISQLSAKSTYLGEMTGIHLALDQGLAELSRDPTINLSDSSVSECRTQLAQMSRDILQKKKPLPFSELRRLLYRSAALIVALPKPDYELLHFVVSIPLLVFTPASVSTACSVWTWIIGERPEVETKIMVEISIGWGLTAKLRRGVFSPSLTSKHPFLRKTEMGAFDREEITRELELATKLFTPHLTLVHLISSRYQALRYRDPTMVLALVRLIQRSGAATPLMSTHPLSREVRFSLIAFGFRLVQGSRLEGLVEHQLRAALYDMAFAWFAASPQWSFGSNRLQIKAEMQLMAELLDLLKLDKVKADHHLTSFPPSLSVIRLPGGISVPQSIKSFDEKRTLLELLVENEYSRFSVWANPLSDGSRGNDYVGDLTKTMNDTLWAQTVGIAWRANPAVAVQMGVRFKIAAVLRELGRLVRIQPHKVVDVPSALKYVLEDHLRLARKDGTDLKWLRYWAPVSPVEAISLFQPEYENHPMVLQYAMRALEQHPVELTFFYVPQVVQALRDDAYGYVEQFIFETSKISQLFCHQIIWNMKANSFKDDDAEVPDSLKPTLDRMTKNIVEALSGEAQDFYEKEFGFFNEVTSISGKLKPFIKKSKPEKKAKIDEEMAKIKVEAGVYLPSNPDGVVVDLDRKSGRPLQSHAKAPFMATFKVRREVTRGEEEEDGGRALNGSGRKKKYEVDVWQGAIFKVGDDCRQDVLALQVIAMFKNIFTTVGIDLYLNPYRVTATGPGCGVIDVVPNATSRDEMGRAKINNLLQFFIGKYGNVDGVAFQKARLNFIQSMAAYSVVCHILQIRDRHNGNMMIDGEGHLVHIDFGFLFDIGPGGMRFEPYSFKLSHEMMDVMGGPNSQGQRMFEELVVKAFMACRPYCEEIVDVCKLMLGTELPSFKGPPTIQRLRDRFRPDLTDREAAKHAQWLVKDAYGNRRAVLYDVLQEVTNDIPFAR
ncbi:hypothetical protein IE53DRAFT_331217 [Violaceomyces palustris]|uniref:Uncharacterized protein n=1 Tax=Violaceomyces palustris TaxID=1673888 RepID=A0ACD0NVT6_9BASI|nr:hypothetical protein IE53DRAFT_331217 [Violaceomyces palustris]